MSFSAEQKKAIMENTPVKNCCRRAMLQGILAAKGEISEEFVTVRVENEETAQFVCRLIAEFFSREATVSTSPRGGRCRLLSFSSPSAEKYLTDLLGGGKIFFLEKCGACRSAFLRGVFLAAGRISDPAVQYSLEFSLGDRVPAFLDFMESIGLYPKIANRRSERILYFRNSEMMQDFFGHCGINGLTFFLLNTKIENDIRNNAMRTKNCEMKNIASAVDASHRQIVILERLEAAHLLSSLPEELEKTARLRLEHRDMSLSQLAAVSVPPVSKSGLSHRLTRIMELGMQMLHTAEG